MSIHQKNKVLAKVANTSVKTINNWRDSKPKLIEALNLYMDLNANFRNSVYCPACEAQPKLEDLLIGGDAYICECGEAVALRRIKKCDSCHTKVPLSITNAEDGELFCESCYAELS